MSRPSSQELADRVREGFGDLDGIDVEEALAALDILSDRLQATEQALGEIMSRCETRRTGVLMDGRSTWAVPLAGEVHEIGRRALEGATE